MTPTEPPDKTAHPQQPSLTDLVRLVLDDTGKLVKAEAQLLKADLTKTLKLSFAFLIVLTASGLLLALMLSLLLAALVLSVHGTPTQALLAAALGNALIGGGGIGWLFVQLRNAAETTEEDAAKLVPGSERGSLAS
jgi:hypothetical protein